jgi:hypothetical protein
MRINLTVCIIYINISKSLILFNLLYMDASLTNGLINNTFYLFKLFILINVNHIIH